MRMWIQWLTVTHICHQSTMTPGHPLHTMQQPDSQQLQYLGTTTSHPQPPPPQQPRYYLITTTCCRGRGKQSIQHATWYSVFRNVFHFTLYSVPHCSVYITVGHFIFGLHQRLTPKFNTKPLIFTCNSIYAIVRICHGNSICPSVRPSVRPSVHPSVCLSVTRVDQSKTVEARITQFSPYSSPIPLVFRG